MTKFFDQVCNELDAMFAAGLISKQTIHNAAKPLIAEASDLHLTGESVSECADRMIMLAGI